MLNQEAYEVFELNHRQKLMREAQDSRSLKLMRNSLTTKNDRGISFISWLKRRQLTHRTNRQEQQYTDKTTNEQGIISG